MQTLMILLKHAESDRDAAFVACQRVTEALLAADRQLEELLNYRRDYEARWTAQFSQLGRMELVHCYHDFMGRLSQAVEQQQHAVHAATGQKDLALRALQERELRVASVGKLIERRCKEIRSNADKREQKQLDEMSARMARNAPFGAAFASTH